MVGFKGFVGGVLLASGAAAQSTVSVWFPGVDQTEGILGSILGSDASATTLMLACARTVPYGDCQIPDGFIYTVGPSTIALSTVITIPDYQYDYTTTAYSVPTETETDIFTCKVTASKSAVCGATKIGSDYTRIQTTTLVGSELGILPVTLTSNLVVQPPPTSMIAPSTTLATRTGGVSTIPTTSSKGLTPSIKTFSTSSTLSSSAASDITTVTKVVPASSSSTTKNAGAMVTRAPWVGVAAAGAFALAAL